MGVVQRTAFRCWAGAEKMAVCCELPAKAGDWALVFGIALGRRNSRATTADRASRTKMQESWVGFRNMGFGEWVCPTFGTEWRSHFCRQEYVYRNYTKGKPVLKRQEVGSRAIESVDQQVYGVGGKRSATPLWFVCLASRGSGAALRLPPHSIEICPTPLTTRNSRKNGSTDFGGCTSLRRLK